MSQRDSVIHLVAGGVGGTVGAIVTCPLEVVKTRQQSSQNCFRFVGELPTIAQDPVPGNKTTCRTLPTPTGNNSNQRRRFWTTAPHCRPQVVALSGYAPPQPTRVPSIAQCIKLIVQHEGPMALFKDVAEGECGRLMWLAGVADVFVSAVRTPQLVQYVHKTRAGFKSITLENRIDSSVPLDGRRSLSYALNIPSLENHLLNLYSLGPNLVGVAPSRAIYFATYSQSKQLWNKILPPDSPVVHVCSASCAGFMASTLTNPIWFVKTRLQLDLNKHSNITAFECVRRIYAKSGIVGFYKGITASYMGISETVIHFVIYEAIKAELMKHRTTGLDERCSKDFFEFMIAGAISKTVASCIAYPHEVARTRLREEGNKYTAFWQTLGLVFKEEGFRGVYRGLTTQLVRQIPNTAIMMATYEAVVYILTARFGTDFYDKDDD